MATLSIYISIYPYPFLEKKKKNARPPRANAPSLLFMRLPADDYRRPKLVQSVHLAKK